jgi:outer membrane protein assembly factor BamA
MRVGFRSTVVEKRLVLYPAACVMLLFLMAGIGGGFGRVVWAQSETAPSASDAGPNWQLTLDGERANWPEAVRTASLDSVHSVGRALLDYLRGEGYYYARLDSAVVDSTVGEGRVHLYARRGPRVEVGRLRITGAEAVPASELRRLMDTQEGETLDAQRLEADIQALLDRYEDLGRPLAQIRVTETKLDSTSPPHLQLALRIDEGPSLWLKRVEVSEGARTSPGLVARLAGLTTGAPLTGYDPEAIRRSLQESPFFESVDPPELKVDPDGGAILHVPIEEAPPGSFDLVLGYLPPSNTRSEGQLVGSGHLLLEHLFGGGRRFDLMLDRRPGQTSIFDLSIADPYLFGLPFRATGQFEGEQRDSTYGERSYGLDAGYRFGDAFELTGSLSQEVVAPGQAGARLRDGRQRIPRSRTLFYGLGLRYETTDRRVNPRRGLRLEVQAEQGRKRRAFQRITPDGDTTRARESFRQERLRGTIRAFLPLFDRHVLVGGGNGSVLRSPAYDRSDLFRFGGAQSLRGYDEDRFLGNVTVRGLVEYRFQLDRRSYAYAFGDLGYVARPALGNAPATQDWRPGYGVGIQIQTAIGLITTTYALNPKVETPVDGRIHFGLSVGL